MSRLTAELVSCLAAELVSCLAAELVSWLTGELVSWLTGAAVAGGALATCDLSSPRGAVVSGPGSGSSETGDAVEVCDPARSADRAALGDHGWADGRPTSGTGRRPSGVSRMSPAGGANPAGTASRWAGA